MVGLCGLDRCYKCVTGAGGGQICVADLTGTLTSCVGNPCSGGGGGGGGGIVIPPVTTSVLASITIPSSATVAIGSSVTIGVTCISASGSVMLCPILTWISQYPSIATVSNFGVVTGISTGLTQIYCSDQITGYGNMSSVTVITPILVSITIPSNATVEIGKTTILTATCKDKNGNVMTCPSLKWGSGTSNATVDNNGVVTGVSVGTVLINCWDMATGLVVSNICSVTIKTPTCTNPRYKCSGVICISDNCDGSGKFTTPDCNNTCTCPDQGSKCDASGMQCYYNVKTCTFDCQPCPSGSECQMQGGLAKCVVVTPPPSGCTNPKYKWVGGICASDDCDGTGTYTDSACTSGGGGGEGGDGDGTTTGVLASITINETASVQVGKTVTLIATCKDTNGNVMACPSLIWQSDNENVAKVSAGVLTGVSVGDATILARDSATNQIVSNAGIATTVSVTTSPNLSDWLQTETCLDSTNKKYCAKNWMLGAGIGVGLILLTRKKS